MDNLHSMLVNWSLFNYSFDIYIISFNNLKAVSNGHFEVTKLLLENKADPNQDDDHGNTSLHACCNLDLEISLKLADILIQSGIDINKKNKVGWTALHCVGKLILKLF